MSEQQTTTEVAVDEQPAAAPAGRASHRSWRTLAENNALLGLLILIGAFFALLPKSRDVFLSPENVAVLLGNQATVALLALAAIIPLISGYFDFSVGANAALSTVITAGMMSFHHLNAMVAILIAVTISSLIGLVNGILVTRFGLNAFVTTLGMATLLGGVIQWYTGGQTILKDISVKLINFGSINIAGIPQVVYVVLVVAAILWYVLTHTPFGRSLYAIGANPRAARLVGVRSDRYVAISFVMAGAIAGLTGVIQLARVGSATADSGNTLLFPALAAAFLGATAVRPGFFNVVGTLIGVLFVSVAVSGLTLAGADAWVSPVFNGAALLVAVGLSSWLGRHRNAT